MSWTPERSDALRRFAEAGKTASQAARALSVTLLAVNGQAARLGIAFRDLSAEIVKLDATARRRASAELVEDPGDAPPPRDEAFQALPGREPVLLVDANERACMWPIVEGDVMAPARPSDGPPRCCGALRPDGQPYCRAHTRLAYQGGSYRRASSIAKAYIRGMERFA